VRDYSIKISNVYFFMIVLAFTLVSFQTLKNLYSPYPYIILVISVAASLLSLFYSARHISKVDKLGLQLTSIFIIVYTYGFFVSLFYNQSFISFEVFGRYFLMLPFLFMSPYFILRKDKLFSLSKMYIFVIVLGSLSIFYQYIFGPVSWFHESSTRLGQVRFASLIGGLTSLGVAGGFALPLAFFLIGNKYLRFTIIAIISVSMALTLQKAAFANLAILLLFYFLYEFSYRKAFLFLIAFISILILLEYTSHGDNWLLEYLKIFAGLKEGVDKSLIGSVVQRLWELPAKLVDEYGYMAIFTGVGVAGGAGILGLSELPMAHNNIADLLFIGGVPLLITCAAVFFYAIKKIRVVFYRKSGHVFYTYYIMVGFNVPFYSGINFHPAMAPFLYILTFSLLLMNRQGFVNYAAPSMRT